MWQSDPAYEETEKLIKRIEKRITEEYTQAEGELTSKLNDYLGKFQTKDEIWQRWVRDGEKTEEEYKKWRTGQIAIGKRWEETRNSISQDLINANHMAQSIVRGHIPEAYALNHDYATYEIEHGAMVDTSYSLYSRQTAERVFRENPQMLPNPGRKVSQDIADGLASRWNNNQIQSVMIQGLLQGESIPKLAKRLRETVGDSNRKASIRNARTMMTGAQNAGRLDAMRRANEMGVKTRKQWMATLDMRTRHWHRELDGVIVDVDEPFENEYGEIMYPGDTNADPANIYNCRCKAVPVLEGFEDDMSDISWRHNKNLGDMTYEEWKREKGKSQPITRQEDVGNRIRMRYINDYRRR